MGHLDDSSGRQATYAEDEVVTEADNIVYSIDLR